MCRHLALLLSLTLALPAAAQQRIPVDLELVLAVDVSRSMDDDELILQREGYAAALEHPAVSSALTMGRLGRAAVLIMEWGGPGAHNVLVDWTVIDSQRAATEVASTLRFAPVKSMRGTSISAALERAAAEIESNAYDGARRVIDVSGDGPNNSGRPVVEVRDELSARGFEINGLPFMFKSPDGIYSVPDLDLYYEDCVIAGDSAFVIPIYELERLVISIRQKLVLEIAGLRPPAERMRKASLTDCMMGERRRRMYDGP